MPDKVIKKDFDENIVQEMAGGIQWVTLQFWLLKIIQVFLQDFDGHKIEMVFRFMWIM